MAWKVTIPILLFLTTGCCIAAAWDGPTSGPRAVSGKRIVFIAQDFRNGGITAVFREFQSAGLLLAWHVEITDGLGNRETIRRAFSEAIKSRPDGIVLGGFNENDVSDLIPPHCPTPLVGWHASASPGSTAHLFVNITTDPLTVADMATRYLIGMADSYAGIVIFNDGRSDIDQAKTRRMKENLRRCSFCQVLEVDTLPIPAAHENMPIEVRRLNTKFGKRWTHTLATNDAYLDSINAPLAAIGRYDIVNISAGDGAFKTLSRIRSGVSQQIATIAEPVGIQGWQIADEFNRAFCGVQPSGYVSRPILATADSLRTKDPLAVDDDIPYRQAYSGIWHLPASRP